MLELLTGKHPWPGLKNDWVAVFNIVKNCETGDGPPRPVHCSAEAMSFLDTCVRGGFGEGRGLIQWFKEMIPMPPVAPVSLGILYPEPDPMSHTYLLAAASN